MNSNLDSEIHDAPPVKRSPVRFFTAWVFALIYWPSAVLLLFLASVFSGWCFRRSKRQAMGQKALALALGGFLKAMEIIGIVRVLDEEVRRHAPTPGPLIIACNHPALWDAPMLIRRLVSVSCIMKAELLTNPLLRSGALFAGFLPNAPRLNMIRKAVERLNEGSRLLLFPEGTRTREENGAINPFRPGFALIASQSGAPVLPVFISSNSPYIRKGWPVWRMPAVPITVTIRVGGIQTFRPGENVRGFSQRLEALFRAELGPPTNGISSSSVAPPGL